MPLPLCFATWPLLWTYLITTPDLRHRTTVTDLSVCCVPQCT